MFHNIPDAIDNCMKRLQDADNKDRSDGTPRFKRLRQIPPETGRFIALLASLSPPVGNLVEIGTSGGYSTLWLALAARTMGLTITTFEILPEKARLAEETFRQAEVLDVVKLIHGDAREFITDHEKITFCFLDAEKEDYAEFYEMLIPRLVTGGLLVADNVISHADTLGSLVNTAEADPRIDSVVVPIGKGELVCRKI